MLKLSLRRGGGRIMMLNFIIGMFCICADAADLPILTEQAPVIEIIENVSGVSDVVELDGTKIFPTEIWEKTGLNLATSDLANMRLICSTFNNIVRTEIFPKHDFAIRINGQYIKSLIEIFDKHIGWLDKVKFRSIHFVNMQEIPGQVINQLLIKLSAKSLPGVALDFHGCFIGNTRIWSILSTLSNFMKISFLNISENNITASVVAPLLITMVSTEISNCDLSHNLIRVVDIRRAKGIAKQDHPITLKISDQERIEGKGKSKKRIKLESLKNLNQNTQAELKSLGINLEFDFTEQTEPTQ